MTDHGAEEALRATAEALGFGRFKATAVYGNAWRLAYADSHAFVKLLPQGEAPRLVAEAEGLARLAPTLRVPTVLAQGETSTQAWLALEWLELQAPDAGCAARLGRALAATHRRSAENFGWHADNWIGPAPQANGWIAEWTQFFAERRLAPQLAAARRNGGGELVGLVERVIAAVPRLLGRHVPKPALIHGDLWNGNWGALADGTPVVFDPAVHYADCECDLAMSELFGGFPRTFYTAYEETRPLAPGYETRRELYQFYHLLNHFNLFGGGYRESAASIAQKLLVRMSDI